MTKRGKTSQGLHNEGDSSPTLAFLVKHEKTLRHFDEFDRAVLRDFHGVTLRFLKKPSDH